jgi:hypothetical protein
VKKKPTMATRILHIQNLLNNEVTTILPVYEIDGRKYVPLENAEHLKNAILQITKLAKGEDG